MSLEIHIPGCDTYMSQSRMKHLPLTNLPNIKYRMTSEPVAQHLKGTKFLGTKTDQVFAGTRTTQTSAIQHQISVYPKKQVSLLLVQFPISVGIHITASPDARITTARTPISKCYPRHRLSGAFSRLFSRFDHITLLYRGIDMYKNHVI